MKLSSSFFIKKGQVGATATLNLSKEVKKQTV